MWVCFFPNKEGSGEMGGGSRRGTREGAGKGRGQRRDEMSPFQGRRKMKANGAGPPRFRAGAVEQ